MLRCGFVVIMSLKNRWWKKKLIFFIHLYSFCRYELANQRANPIRRRNDANLKIYLVILYNVCVCLSIYHVSLDLLIYAGYPLSASASTVDANYNAVKKFCPSASFALCVVSLSIHLSSSSSSSSSRRSSRHSLSRRPFCCVFSSLRSSLRRLSG